MSRALKSMDGHRRDGHRPEDEWRKPEPTTVEPSNWSSGKASADLLASVWMAMALPLGREGRDFASLGTAAEKDL